MFSLASTSAWAHYHLTPKMRDVLTRIGGNRDYDDPDAWLFATSMIANNNDNVSDIIETVNATADAAAAAPEVVNERELELYRKRRMVTALRSERIRDRSSQITAQDMLQHFDKISLQDCELLLGRVDADGFWETARRRLDTTLSVICHALVGDNRMMPHSQLQHLMNRLNPITISMQLYHWKSHQHGQALSSIKHYIHLYHNHHREELWTLLTDACCVRSGMDAAMTVCSECAALITSEMRKTAVEGRNDAFPIVWLACTGSIVDVYAALNALHMDFPRGIDMAVYQFNRMMRPSNNGEMKRGELIVNMIQYFVRYILVMVNGERLLHHGVNRTKQNDIHRILPAHSSLRFSFMPVTQEAFAVGILMQLIVASDMAIVDDADERSLVKMAASLEELHEANQRFKNLFHACRLNEIRTAFTAKCQSIGRFDEVSRKRNDLRAASNAPMSQVPIQSFTADQPCFYKRGSVRDGSDINVDALTGAMAKAALGDANEE